MRFLEIQTPRLMVEVEFSEQQNNALYHSYRNELGKNVI